MYKVFMENTRYQNLQRKTDFEKNNMKTVTKTLTFLGPRIWGIMTDYIYFVLN